MCGAGGESSEVSRVSEANEMMLARGTSRSEEMRSDEGDESETTRSEEDDERERRKRKPWGTS